MKKYFINAFINKIRFFESGLVCFYSFSIFIFLHPKYFAACHLFYAPGPDLSESTTVSVCTECSNVLTEKPNIYRNSPKTKCNQNFCQSLNTREINTIYTFINFFREFFTHTNIINIICRSNRHRYYNRR